MGSSRYQIVHYRYESRSGWEPKLLFPETAVPRIWRIMRLRRDLGINWSGIGVVLDLLDKIEELEREIAWLRKQL